MAAERERASTGVLAVAAGVWAVWCLLAVAPAAYIVSIAASVTGRSALLKDALFGVAVELVVLGVTAWIAFRLLRRLGPPCSYWVVGPAGYLVSYVAWVALTYVLGHTIIGVDASSVMRLVASMGIASAGAYLGLCTVPAWAVPGRRGSEPGPPASGTGAPSRPGEDPDTGE